MTPLQVAENSKNMSSLRKARSVQDILSILSSIRAATMAHASTIESMSLAASRLKQNRIKAVTLDHNHSLTGRNLSSYKGLVERLSKHYRILEALAVHKIEISAIEANLLQNSTARKKDETLSVVMDLHGYVHKAYIRCLRSIHILAGKYQPRELVTLRAAVVDYIEDILPSTRYSRISSNVFLSEKTEQGIQKFVFQQYINIRGLVDDDSFVVDDFYVILSCQVDNVGNALYNVTTYKEFKTPGSFPLGVKLESLDEANDLVGKLLLASYVKLLADMPQLKSVKTLGVKKVKVEPKVLTLILKSDISAKQINAILSEVLPTLYALLGAQGSNKRQILHRVRKSGGRKIIEFILDKSESRAEVVQTKLGELRSLFSLSEPDIHIIEQALAGV